MMFAQKLKSTVFATSAAGLLVVGLGAGSAHAINIGGVTFQAGAHMEVASVFENVITGNGQTLSGYGEISQINGKQSIEGDGTGFCQIGCELTYEFGGFTSINFSPLFGTVQFTGGWANFYVDASPDFDASGNTAANRTAATDGALWLTLAGHPNLAFVAGSGVVNAVLFGSGISLGTGNDFGSGSAIMDVDFTGNANGNTAGAGALANLNFDTDTVPDNVMSMGDFTLSSTFGTFALPAALAAECQPDPTNANFTCLAGSASLEGLAISEPATLGLVGLGLIGLGAIRRRRPTAA